MPVMLAPSTLRSVEWVLGRLRLSTDEGQLSWPQSPNLALSPGNETTLTFDATATKPDGTYYNQAWVEFVPSWEVSTTTSARTPPTAPVTVGTGDPACGGGVIVTKSVDLQTPVPDVENTFTYTISIDNKTSFDVPLGQLKDMLPPGFTYIAGSVDPSSFWPYEPNGVTFAEPPEEFERWTLNWNINEAASVPAGTVVTQIFQALATPEPGYDYFNEAWVKIDPADCIGCPVTPGNSPKTSTSGPSGGSNIQMPTTYDIQAIAADGTILSRIIIQINGDLDVISWQEL